MVTSDPSQFLWVEKYRPKSLTDVSHQTEIISTLTNAVETNRLPHLLFYGPPGVSFIHYMFVCGLFLLYIAYYYLYIILLYVIEKHSTFECFLFKLIF